MVVVDYEAEREWIVAEWDMFTIDNSAGKDLTLRDFGRHRNYVQHLTDQEVLDMVGGRRPMPFCYLRIDTTDEPLKIGECRVFSGNIEPIYFRR